METYAAADVLVNVKGKALFEFSDSDMVKVEFPDELFKTVVGADGFGARVAMASRMLRVTVTLMATSPSNNDLANLLSDDMFSRDSTFPMEIVDGRLGTICSANEAYIVKMPEVDFKKDMSNRVWVFEAVSGAINIKGQDI